jgi:hypothetical protein
MDGIFRERTRHCGPEHLFETLDGAYSARRKIDRRDATSCLKISSWPGLALGVAEGLFGKNVPLQFLPTLLIRGRGLLTLVQQSQYATV